MEKEVLESALKKHWKDSSIATVVRVDSSSGATKYQGYNSTITRLKLEVILGNGRKASRSLILKDAKALDIQGAEFIKNYQVFKIETMMYENVLRGMEYLMEEFDDEDDILWCNLIHHIPYSSLVLEDLKASGYDHVERGVFFDLDHSLLAVNSLAKYHGMCKVLEERGHVSKESYKEWFVFGDGEMHKLWFWNTKALIQGVKKYWEPSWSPIVDKINITFESLHDKLKKIGEVDKEGFNVLNHGDCHKNNIMFKYSWNGKPVTMKLLDFQIPHYGSPCWDLTFMFYLGVDPFIRRAQSHLLLETYHNSLSRTLGTFHYKGRKPSLDEIKKLMETYSFVGLYLVLFGFPGMFISKEIDLFGDFERMVDGDDNGQCSLEIYDSHSFKNALGPDLKELVLNFCE